MFSEATLCRFVVGLVRVGLLILVKYFAVYSSFEGGDLYEVAHCLPDVRMAACPTSLLLCLRDTFDRLLVLITFVDSVLIVDLYACPC